MGVPLIIAGWPKGMDNIHYPHELPDGALRDAVNVDVLDSGKLRMRKGSTSAVVATATHSLWDNENLSKSYYVAGTTLYSITDKLVSTSIVTGLADGAKVAFLQINGEVFWSNGYVSGRIVNDVNHPLGLETPARVAVMAQTVGALPAGRYQVSTTFKNAAGEESGAMNGEPITLTATSGIAITGMPPAQNASITYRCIYITPTNGDVFYKIATLPVATTTYTLANMPPQTVALRTQDTQPMPAGRILAYLNGILYVAVGNMIYHSEPMRYGQCAIRKNFYIYSVDVDVMLATPAGLYVCADKTYLMENPGTSEVVQRHIYPFGGVFGTGVYLPNSEDVAWFSPKGQVIVVDGKPTIPAEKLFVPSEMTEGAALVREQNGVRQIINVAHTDVANTLEHTGV